MRLHRPHIPTEVRCRVVLRQLGEMWIDQVIANHRKALGKLLQDKLSVLREVLHSDNLALDHDPALTNRKFDPTTGEYDPPANSPEHLIYRTKADHDIKTRVRGDGAQHSDLALRRKLKNIEANRQGKQKRKIPQRPDPWPKGRKLRSRP